jgi:hypothetical protein
VRIQFQMEGGLAYFPGQSKPVTIDTDALRTEEAAELTRQVQSVGFFDLPSVVGAARSGAADYRRYTIRVEENERHHTVHLAEPIADPTLQGLVRTLQSMARSQRAGGPASDRPPE